MRYFSALWARMYRLSANSCATISSTAIFLSQQSRQYFSSPRGSEMSLAPHSAHRDLATDLRGILQFYLFLERGRIHALGVFLDHAPRREARRHGADRVLHRRDPAVRDVGSIAVVERRD